MSGSNMRSVKSGHGLSGSGKGRPPAMGVTGPGGSFVGTNLEKDVNRSVSDNNTTDKGKARSGNTTAQVGKTGGMSRKEKSSVGY